MRKRLRPRWIILIVAVLLVLGGIRRAEQRGHRTIHGIARAPQSQSTIQPWLQNAEPVGWDASANRIIVNRRGPSDRWNAYTITPDGHDERCITCARPSFPGVGTATNRGASDVSPNGRYVIVVVEKGSHPGTIGGAASEFGRGVYCDLWLMTTDGRHAWQLTDVPVSSGVGVDWPRFDRTGTQLVWAQMYGAPGFGHPLGQWALHVARIVWSDGAPHLADARTYDPSPGHYYEPYGFSPDDERILFASDIRVAAGFLSPSAFNAQIYTIDAATLGDLQRVSPAYTLHGSFSDYNEFAYYIPGTDRILFARTDGAAGHGLDYWTVNDNGTDATRLTYMNQPGNPQYMGYSIGGSVAFDPRDPKRFVAGVSNSLGDESVQAIWVQIH